MLTLAAKLKGCKVMATAGDDEKCRWLREEVGVDLAINYKSPDFTKQFRSFGFIDVVRLTLSLPRSHASGV